MPEVNQFMQLFLIIYNDNDFKTKLLKNNLFFKEGIKNFSHNETFSK